MAVDPDRILAQLDAHAASFNFPTLDNGYVFLVDTRLHAFADAERWTLLMEVVGYSPRAGRLDTCLYLYGEPLARAPGLANEDFLHPVDDDDLEDPENPEHARPGVDAVRVRGQKIALATRAEPWPLRELFRSLVPAHRELLFATESELRARIPAGLPRLLQLEAWNHPDVAGGECPSEHETFVQLAQVLSLRAPSLYRPSLAPNTHWENWPEGGSL